MDVILGVIIGLAVGALIGFLVKSGRSNSDSSDNPLIKDLKEQLEREKNSTTAATKLTDELETMKKTVEKLTEAAGAADLRRVRAETEITEQVKSMASHNENLVKQTRAIAGALASSQTRGKFGEAQLQLLLEQAGLREGHEYDAQRSTTDSDSSGIPDITVHMPGGSKLFIDSKFPFDRFLEAFGTEDQSQRDELLALHTKDLLKHVDALSKRGYHKSQGSPDFVVLFLPFETLLAEALRIDPTLLEKAFKVGVTLATPTTTMALLRTVGHIFTRNQLAENADDITKVAATFLKNITLLHSKIVAVGKAINSTSKAYEDLVPTAEKTVLSPARRIHKLGVAGDKEKLAIEYPDAPADVRALNNPDLDAPDDFIDVEVVEE